MGLMLDVVDVDACDGLAAGEAVGLITGLGFGEVAEDALGDADRPALLGGTGTQQAYGLGVYGVDGDALGDAVGPALGLRLVLWSTVEGGLGDAGVYGDALGDDFISGLKVLMIK